MEAALNIDADAFANAFQMNMDGDELMELLMSMGSTENASYESNLQKLGYVDFDNPSGIDIYPKDFESKESVVGILDDYNARMEAEGKGRAGDYLYRPCWNTYVLSYRYCGYYQLCPYSLCGNFLVVSSIMIGVILYQRP